MSIDLIAIHRKTGLTDRAIKKQIRDGAVLHCGRPLDERTVYPIEIAGPDGVYTLRCAGKRSIQAILDHFDRVQERIDAGHEEQVRRRLADIERQIEGLPASGERAHRAREALGLAMMSALRSEPPTYP